MADDENDSLDNWEEQADSGLLDKRLEEMSIDFHSKSREEKKQAPAVGSGEMLLSDDSGRTQYQPQVRILRREAQSSFSSPPNHNITGSAGASKPSKYSKSLQQREAEYAQARLRIFGSLPPEDGDDDDDDDEENDVNCAAKNDVNSIQSQSIPQIMKPDPISPHMSILRQPKGPDGTCGFKKPDLT